MLVKVNRWTISISFTENSWNISFAVTIAWIPLNSAALSDSLQKLLQVSHITWTLPLKFDFHDPFHKGYFYSLHRYQHSDTNLLLTKREVRTGKSWLEVVAVQKAARAGDSSKWVMVLGPNLFILNVPAFVMRNTRLLTVSVKTDRMAQSRPSKNVWIYVRVYFIIKINAHMVN